MPTVIRRAIESDVPVILHFIRELAQYERLAHRVAATEERLRETLFGALPAAEVLLADLDDECVGFAVFFSTYSTFLAQPGIYVEDLFVKPEARGKGVGLALVRQVAQVAVERGCGRMEWRVLDWNEPAIRFYQRLGAEPQTEGTKYRVLGKAIEKIAFGSAG